MLQSSDSALCMQTQQEGERGRLSLGHVPKLIWLGDRGVPAAAKASGVVDGEEPGGSDHAPGGWPPLTPGSGVGQPRGAELSADLGWSSNPEPTGGCVTLGKSLPIWAHSLCLCEIHLPSLSLCEVSLSSFLSICSTLPVPGGMDRANSRSALKCPWA